jgi:hypothetical protein
LNLKNAIGMAAKERKENALHETINVPDIHREGGAQSGESFGRICFSL